MGSGGGVATGGVGVCVRVVVCSVCTVQREVVGGGRRVASIVCGGRRYVAVYLLAHIWEEFLGE